MSIRDIVKTNGNTSNLPVKRGETGFPSLYHEVADWMDNWDRRFSDFFNGSFDLLPGRLANWSSFTPAVNLSETEQEFKVTAELPGLDKNDITILLEKDALVITGEKKSEVEDNKGYHRVERAYGAFRRAIPLQGHIDQDKVDATFKNGVLTVSLPKLPLDEVTSRKIEIKA